MYIITVYRMGGFILEKVHFLHIRTITSKILPTGLLRPTRCVGMMQACKGVADPRGLFLTKLCQKKYREKFLIYKPVGDHTFSMYAYFPNISDPSPCTHSISVHTLTLIFQTPSALANIFFTSKIFRHIGYLINVTLWLFLVYVHVFLCIST